MDHYCIASDSHSWQYYGRRDWLDALGGVGRSIFWGSVGGRHCGPRDFGIDAFVCEHTVFATGGQTGLLGAIVVGQKGF